ncbi:hypothetical protein SYNPS1DRAFT_26832 [Syncephalis pseudoplumigaleata]|uniref:UBZ4-type domain-containing protein n=1 Tax=Syncephalis pseudoplumigaleata TaxID=1712513 RepID=A0A4P9Z6N2_9FUNG|nr:hypothetical protein SYNPS1DRAFT_26832 [Syncephalis pseudoplumigaleata]|eukprot:RKP27511.1 hypothetical protein SYNPS1DRAFT_26832 [Syncephalis pseudoplumigaleata]
MLTDSDDEQLLAEMALTASSFEITPVATRTQPATKRKQPSTTRAAEVVDAERAGTSSRQTEKPQRKIMRITLTPEYEGPASTTAMSNCPICHEQFDRHLLEAHAACCQGKDAVQGDTGICPVCNQSFPIDKLEAHVNEELGQWNEEEEEGEGEGEGEGDHQADASTATLIANDLAELQQLDESIFISDDENDWFNDRPSGIEILSQQQQPATATTAAATSTDKSAGQLSPLHGLINLHEARQQYPELEGYFNQFSMENGAKRRRA